MKILLVEDDPILREGLSDLLGGALLRTRRDRLGYAVFWTRGAEERLFCRCYFAGPQKEIGFFDAEGGEERVSLERIEDIEHYAERLKRLATGWA